MDAVIIFILLLIINYMLLSFLRKRHRLPNTGILNYLFFYHTFFYIIYYIYALFRPSDSKFYYAVSLANQDHWLDYVKTGTDFIVFLAIPFVKLGLSYEAVMLIFSWFGYLGFVYTYFLFKENIPERIRILRMDFLTLLLFLPNMHFWTASLGKGAVIFLGLMMVTYAMAKPKQRLFTLMIGSFLVYMVRPHVMLFVVVGIMVGYLTGKERISPLTKVFITLVAVLFLILASDKILQIVNLENSENLTQDFLEFSELQSQRLSESAGSGVDMNNYSLPFKFFTFWFRPLFIDAPNFIGLIVSFENLLYLYIFSKVFNRTFFRFLKQAPRMVKMAATTFLLATFALTFLMSNLGIIMRQKSQVMYFAFFTIYYFLALKQRYKRKMHLKKIQQKNEERKLYHIT